MTLDIFLINSIIPLMLAFVLWVNSSKTTVAKRFLSWAMVNAGVSFFITHQYMNGNYELYVILHPLGVATILFIYPSFYQYVSHLTGAHQLKRRLFVPGMVFGLVSLVVFLGLLSHEEQIYFLSDYRTQPGTDHWRLQVNQWFRLLNVALIFFQIGWFFFKTNALLKKYHAEIANVFSDVSQLKLSRVKILNTSFIVAAIACISFYVINPVKVFGTTQALEYPFFLLALILSMLGAIGVSQNEAPDLILQPQPAPSSSEATSETTVDDFFAKIDLYMNRERPYLEPAFNIVQMAAAIGSNRTYISNCINRNKGMNFSQYVNAYRLAQAKQLLIEKRQLPVADIALHSGFGSVSAFSRCFKESEKMTPTEYRDQGKS
ncbi:AraC-like DNA-binding protein [Breznakibacter xylanolyticus]|uniref:AraC-like DNA-binding protein n=1 Tax=Breznakibacter xylanolyticus TaxID=990 RepID=A0A2W7N8Q0_9BACT|nr:helix-turn-helix domain-containing protein [Breznakibacter xylanolyticus]PZX16410.1 AraC-like DNA-binding protein [Breznakibacter xylanolyticus]